MAPRRRPTYQGRRDRQKLRRVDDDETNPDKGKVPKRKYALVFGYKGTAYNGLQKQADEGSGVKTVEGVLQDAMFRIHAISEAQMADPFKLHWARVGRTDRGVHAVCQVICAKLSMGPLTEDDKRFIEAKKARDRAQAPDNEENTLTASEPGPIKTEENTTQASTTEAAGNSLVRSQMFSGAASEDKSLEGAHIKPEDPTDVTEEDHPGELQRIRELRFLANLQALLPDDIELFDVVRVWGTWDARMKAGRRVYEYCLPVAALQKVQLRDNHEAFVKFCQSLNVEDMDSKFCPHNLKEKLFAALRLKDDDIVRQLRDDRSETGLATIAERWRTELSTIRRLFYTANEDKRKELWQSFGATLPSDVSKPPYPPPAVSSFYNIPSVTAEQAADFTDENLQEFQEILSMLQGSYHWFNFTSRISATDQTGQRFVEQIRAYRVKASYLGEDMIVVRIIGQSFLLNQIRKMIAMAVEIYMGMAPWAAIKDLLNPPLEPKKHVHVAPGEGLLLERVFFDIQDKQQRISLSKLVLHHPFELETPYGSVMTDFLEKGTYPDTQEDNINTRGVFRKGPKPVNLLLDNDDNSPPSTLTLNWDDDDKDLPTWAKLLRYKHKQLHPWIGDLFKQSQTWRKFLGDILWHPFALENFPVPLLRSLDPGNPQAEEN